MEVKVTEILFRPNFYAHDGQSSSPLRRSIVRNKVDTTVEIKFNLVTNKQSWFSSETEGRRIAMTVDWGCLFWRSCQ